MSVAVRHSSSGDYTESTQWHEAALAAFRGLGDDARTAHVLTRQAIDAWRTGDTGQAKALAEESRSLHSSTRDEAQALYLLGNVAFTEGRGDEALELLSRSADLSGQDGDRWFQEGALLNYAECALTLGRLDEVSAPMRGVLETARSVNDRRHLVYAMALLAWLATARRELDRAGRVWGAIETEAMRAPVGQWETEQDDYALHVVRDDPAFERGRAAGRGLTFDEALDEALAQPD